MIASQVGKVVPFVLTVLVLMSGCLQKVEKLSDYVVLAYRGSSERPYLPLVMYVGEDKLPEFDKLLGSPVGLLPKKYTISESIFIDLGKAIEKSSNNTLTEDKEHTPFVIILYRDDIHGGKSIPAKTYRLGYRSMGLFVADAKRVLCGNQSKLVCEEIGALVEKMREWEQYERKYGALMKANGPTVGTR